MTSAHTLRNHVTSGARGSGQARRPTITARFDDGLPSGVSLQQFPPTPICQRELKVL
jgi:hypothetical protein